ncbi:hypothetical protein GG344DRAFT_72260 [Lentinula edodes]|nr:hypothetical protein GG344DRAFT_72260 [Lentinula edodes]
MTATPAASKELHYMFAHIEDDKLVEDPDDPTSIRIQRPQIHRTWVLLVPETRIMYAPSETLWDRIAECPLLSITPDSGRFGSLAPFLSLFRPSIPSPYPFYRSPFSKAPPKGATASTFINDHKLCPNVQGAVYLTDQHVEVLSPSLPLYFSEYDTRSMENLLRFMTTLRNLFRSLLKFYEKPNEYAIESDQASFPYPRSYRSFGTTV